MNLPFVVLKQNPTIFSIKLTVNEIFAKTTISRDIFCDTLMDGALLGFGLKPQNDETIQATKIQLSLNFSEVKCLIFPGL